MDKPKNCLIVEDHAQARQWLARAVKKAFAVDADVAVSIKTAIASVAKSVPDLVLVDLGLPDGNGQELIEHLVKVRRQQHPSMNIVVATVMNDNASVFSAIRQGADGYLLKEESQKNLVEMLEGIVEDRPALSPSIAMRLLRHFRLEENEAVLAPREQDVLQLIAKGFTVNRVAEMLGITYYTAAGYVRDIYRKLDVNNRAEATVEATRRGLI